MEKKKMTILILGASGYVGNILTRRLLKEGYHVKAAGRSVDKLKNVFGSENPHLSFCNADVLAPDSLREACKGVDVVYYLVHSMNSQTYDFERSDRIAANNMVRIADQCRIKRIIYLGGLGDVDKNLSKHLRSRHEVSIILKSGRVPVTVLRAAMIIGAGSISFQILGYLVKRLPVMITPRWVSTPNQPIAIKNVIEYLAACLKKKETTGKTYDIGGKEILSYKELMILYAQESGLKKRLIIPVPVLTPKLSSLWIHLVTPVPSYIARPLAEGLRNPVTCKDQSILNIIPQELLDCRQAIKEALAEEKE